MNKKILLTVLLVTILILAGCDDDTDSDIDGANGDGRVVLNNLKVPDELQIIDPETNRKTQDLNMQFNKLREELNNEDDISEEEKRRLEEEMDNIQTELMGLIQNASMINDYETISIVFEKIKAAEITYDDTILNVDDDERFYAIHPNYLNQEDDQLNFKNGYIGSLYVFDDDTLVISSIKHDEQTPKSIEIQFDYEWFEQQINE